MAERASSICFILLTFLCLSPFYYSGVTIIASSLKPGDEALRAKEWADPDSWQPAECEVLGTGVAFRGNCQMGMSGETLSEETHSIQVSECPGMHWCAEIGGPCSCDGRVTLAPSSYGNYGIEHDLDRFGQDVVSVDLNGTASVLQCTFGHGQLFTKDPAPTKHKSCFCTPQTVLEAVEGASYDRLNPTAVHDSDPHRYQCEQQSLLEYTRPTNGLPAMQSTPGVSTDELTWSLQRFKPTEFLEFRDDYIMSHKTSSTRRRKACDKVFEPWALVKVRGPGADGRQQTAVRCAYQYGVPFASRMSHTPDAKDLAFGVWTFPTLPCSVRASEFKGLSLCSIALDDVQQLLTEEQGRRNMGFYFGLIFLGFSMYFTYLCIGDAVLSLCRPEGYGQPLLAA